MHVIRKRKEELLQLHAKHLPRQDGPQTNGQAKLPRQPHYLPASPRSDEEVIEKVRSERNGKFERLWHGDLSDYGGDHSSADDGFVHKLWSYTQDEEQVKRIHAMSGLHRPEKSGRRADYLRRSIARAQKNVDWFYPWPGEAWAAFTVGANRHATKTTQSSSRTSTLKGSGRDDDFATLCKAVPFAGMGEPKEHRDVLAGLIPESYPTVLHGDGGSAKSMLALSLGVAVAGDANTWLGRAVTTAPVLYVDFELDQDEQNRRARRIIKGAGLEKPPEGLLYLCALGHGPVEALRAAYAECREHGVKFLILDSFGLAFSGEMEAAKDIIGFFNEVMEPFRALGVTVLIIDHQARQQGAEKYQSKSAFGSVYKTNLARSVVQVEATERGGDYLDLRLRHKKHNFGALAEPFGAKITFADSVVIRELELDETDLAEEGTLNAADRLKLVLQNGPAFPDELIERTGLASSTVKNVLTRLRKVRVVEATGERKPGGQEQVTLVAQSSSCTSPLKGSGRDDDCETKSTNEDEGNAGLWEDGVQRADDDAGNPPEELSTLLDAERRPDWVRRQARKCVEEGSPERLLKPLASSVAADRLGNVRRWEEALPFVREHLEALASEGTPGGAA